MSKRDTRFVAATTSRLRVMRNGGNIAKRMAAAFLVAHTYRTEGSGAGTRCEMGWSRSDGKGSRTDRRDREPLTPADLLHSSSRGSSDLE
jgi:hypothetical protein